MKSWGWVKLLRNALRSKKNNGINTDNGKSSIEMWSHLRGKTSTEGGKPRDCHFSKGSHLFKKKGITEISKVRVSLTKVLKTPNVMKQLVPH